MPIPEGEGGPIILLTGGSGYVGGRLIPLLERQGGKLRCLARNPEKMRSRVRATTEVVPGRRARSGRRWTGRCGASTRPTTSST